MAKIKGHRGLFRREFVDKNGMLCESPHIWGYWICKGCAEHSGCVCARGCKKHPAGGIKHPPKGRHRQNLGTVKVKDAVEKLAQFKGKPASFAPVKPEALTVGKLLDDYLAFTESHCKRSTFSAYSDIARKHLYPAFGFVSALAMISDEEPLTNFVNGKKQEKKLEDGTTEGPFSASGINAMLTLLDSAYRFAHKALAEQHPDIKQHKLENNDARKQFFTEGEIQTLLRNLPAEIARPIRIMNITGWRSISEVFTRKRHHMDLKKGLLILEANETKNGKPREFPLNNTLKAILEEQDAETRRIEREKGILISWLFHDEDGNPFVTFYPGRGVWKPTRGFRASWTQALKASGLAGRRLHDFRRTAIRRFVERGIDDGVGMRMSGHQTTAVYFQYKAIAHQDLVDAAAKLDDAMPEKKGKKSTV